MSASVPRPDTWDHHPGNLLMPAERDNEFRLRVVPIVAVNDRVLVVQRRLIPKKLHSWERGSLCRDRIGAQAPVQVLQDIAHELGCRQFKKCIFVASHHERRERKKAKPPSRSNSFVRSATCWRCRNTSDLGRSASQSL
jgi:hypothetical protein